MGWAGPFQLSDGRMGGYAVQATCDLSGCEAKIDRGLAYVCGDMHDGDEYACGRYFCQAHLFMGATIPRSQMCGECCDNFERDYPDEYNELYEKFMGRVNDIRETLGEPD